MARKLVAASIQEVPAFQPCNQLINSIKRILVWESIAVVAHDWKTESNRVPVAAVSSLSPLTAAFVDSTIFADQEVVANVRPSWETIVVLIKFCIFTSRIHMIILDALHHSNTSFLVGTVRARRMMPDKTVARRQLKVGHSDGTSCLPFNPRNESCRELLTFFVRGLSTSWAERIARWQIIVSCIVINNSRAAGFQVRAPLLRIIQRRKAFARDFAAELVAVVTIKIISSDVNWRIWVFLI